MVTPIYKLSELSEGSLTFDAYNDRLLGFESLTGIIPAHDDVVNAPVPVLQNNLIYKIGSAPTGIYSGKSNKYHLQIDNQAHFFDSNQLDIRRCNQIFYRDGSVIVDPYSSSDVIYSADNQVTTLTKVSKFIFLDANNYTFSSVILDFVSVDFADSFYLINVGNFPVYLYLSPLAYMSFNSLDLLENQVKEVIQINGNLLCVD